MKVSATAEKKKFRPCSPDECQCGAIKRIRITDGIVVHCYYCTACKDLCIHSWCEVEAMEMLRNVIFGIGMDGNCEAIDKLDDAIELASSQKQKVEPKTKVEGPFPTLREFLS